MIILLSDHRIDIEIKDILVEFGFKESGSESNTLSHHFIIINEETHTFKVTNSNRKRGDTINAITDKGWKPYLMEELLNPKKKTPLYPFRPKSGLRKKLESYRETKGFSMSATVSFIVSTFFENGLHEVRNKNNS